MYRSIEIMNKLLEKDFKNKKSFTEELERLCDLVDCDNVEHKLYLARRLSEVQRCLEIAEDALRHLNEIADIRCPAIPCQANYNCGSVECKEFRFRFLLQQAADRLNKREVEND